MTYIPRTTQYTREHVNLVRAMRKADGFLLCSLKARHVIATTERWFFDEILPILHKACTCPDRGCPVHDVYKKDSIAKVLFK